MKGLKLPVILFMTFTIIGIAQAATLFEDNFDNGLGQWNLYGSPSPLILSSVAGRTNVFDNNGDSWCSSGAVSQTLMTFPTDISVESDVFLTSPNPSGCWQQAIVGITQNPNPISSSNCPGTEYSNGVVIGINYIGDACWATPSQYRRHAYFTISMLAEDGTSESPPPYMPADSYVNGWHTLKIVVNQDRYVSFYVDDTLLYQSTKKLAPSVLQIQRINLGDRSSGSAGKAYHDNIKISSIQESMPQIVNVKEIIIETRTIPSTNINQLVQFLKQANVQGISIAFRDDGDSNRENSGKLYYSSDLDYTVGYYPDSQTLDTIIKTAHENNIKVYAWVPVFNDKLFADAMGDNSESNPMGIRMFDRYAGFTDNEGLTTRFVNPTNEIVTNHELDILNEIAQKYNKDSESDLIYIDGFRLDWCRFDNDWQDWSEVSKSKFEADEGFDPDIMPEKWQTQEEKRNYIKWIDWRADKIASFISTAKQNIHAINPEFEIGVYILPFSVQSKPANKAYETNSMTGQDYAKIGSIGLDIMPMVYWQDYTQPADFNTWTTTVIKNSASLAGKKSTVIPVFSVTRQVKPKYWGVDKISEEDVHNYLSTSFQIAQKNKNIKEISLFYFNEWTVTEFNRAIAANTVTI